eukprot:CAMPEP_0198127088 /NCGR_PEP_ID=MMETSP1442-20131203/46415_1 /TAXON_ID= /ORGANISM="Craspedostauros australis, Strain CCMP3328" /LENGTH=95 /DNA_ID=CAMNT_0043787011 /DNA_START=576 /DNA_END=859 /DNA_ORIENTATION=+
MREFAEFAGGCDDGRAVVNLNGTGRDRRCWASGGCLIELLHPDARLAHAEEIPDQLAEVDATLGLEEEGELVAIELIFGIDDVHREAALLDLRPA